MFGKLLADSGGADQIVDTIIGRVPRAPLPWAMALVGALIGLPMFFEIGLVLLMPVIFLVARRSGLSLIKVGIPALAGLSVMHGLVPPHPGPLVAIAALNADLGITLALGVLIALPTVVIAGPLFATLRRALGGRPRPAPVRRRRTMPAAGRTGGGADRRRRDRATPGRRPAAARRFGVTLATVLLPVVLMMGKALADIFIPTRGTHPQRPRLPRHPAGRPAARRARRDVHPGSRRGHGRRAIRHRRAVAAAIAGILLIVAAGGGFKQTLIDTGIGDLIAGWVEDSGTRCCCSPGWSPC